MKNDPGFWKNVQSRAVRCLGRMNDDVASRDAVRLMIYVFA
jgi:hypothetical protein